MHPQGAAIVVPANNAGGQEKPNIKKLPTEFYSDRQFDSLLQGNPALRLFGHVTLHLRIVSEVIHV